MVSALGIVCVLAGYAAGYGTAIFVGRDWKRFIHRAEERDQ